MSDAERLAAIEARERAAWQWYTLPMHTSAPMCYLMAVGGGRIARDLSPEDAALIVAARADIPWLVAYARQQRERAEKAEEELRIASDQWDEN